MTPAPYTRVPAPTLKINDVLGAPRGEHLGEQIATANLFAYLEANGWNISEVDDGEETVALDTPQEAMELIFNLDEARVTFTNGTERHTVLLVLGNGPDLIVDWGFLKDDGDGFCAVMDEFETDEFFQ